MESKTATTVRNPDTATSNSPSIDSSVLQLQIHVMNEKYRETTRNNPRNSLRIIQWGTQIGVEEWFATLAETISRTCASICIVDTEKAGLRAIHTGAVKTQPHLSISTVYSTHLYSDELAKALVDSHSKYDIVFSHFGATFASSESTLCSFINSASKMLSADGWLVVFSWDYSRVREMLAMSGSGTDTEIVPNTILFHLQNTVGWEKTASLGPGTPYTWASWGPEQKWSFDDNTQYMIPLQDLRKPASNYGLRLISSRTAYSILNHSTKASVSYPGHSTFEVLSLITVSIFGR